MTAVSSTPEAFGQYIRDEIAQWRKVGIALDVRPMQELIEAAA